MKGKSKTQLHRQIKHVGRKERERERERRDVDVAEEKAKDDKGTEEDDKDVGDERDEARFYISAVVVRQTPAYHHY